MNIKDLEFTTSPITADIEFLTQKINEDICELAPITSFGFFMKNQTGHIIAGCNGNVIFGAIYTDQLWVDQNYRKQGLGKQLMDAVHEYGRKIGCTMATLNTMSFQKAKDFYEKLGYVIDFKREGYYQNSSLLFMKKEL